MTAYREPDLASKLSSLENRISKLEKAPRVVKSKAPRTPLGDSECLTAVIGLFILCCTILITLGMFSCENSDTIKINNCIRQCGENNIGIPYVDMPGIENDQACRCKDSPPLIKEENHEQEE